MAEPGGTRNASPPLLRRGFAIRARLDAHLGRAPVLAVAAPAGFGKTQLLVHWYHQHLRQGRSVRWLSLDAGGETLPRWTGPRWTGPRETMFIDNVTADRAWLVDLAADMPQGSCLVLAGRNLPTVAGERLGAADLAFTDTEARALLRDRLPASAIEQVAAAAALCDGWPLAFNLAEAAFARDAGAGEAMADLGAGLGRVADMLLAGELDAGDRLALAEVSLVNPIEPALAARVSGRDNGGDLLARAEAARLLQAVSNDGRLRVSHYAAVLLAEWRAPIAADRLHHIHATAADWYQTRGAPLDVIRHAVAIDDRPRAARLLRQNLLHMVAGGDFDRAREWLPALFAEDVLADETLRFSTALVHVVAGEPQQAEQYLTREQRPQHLLLRTLLANFADDPDTGARLLAELGGPETLPEVLRPIHGNLTRWISYSGGDYRLVERADTRLDTPATEPERVYDNCFALFRQATRWLALGQGWRAIELLEARLTVTEQRLGRDAFPATLFSFALAGALLQVGERERAAAALADRAATRRNQLTVDPLALSMTTQARLACAAGETGRAEEIIDRFRRIGAERGLVRLEAQCIAERVRLCGGALGSATLQELLSTLLGMADEARALALNGRWIRLPALIGAAHAARHLGMSGRALALLAEAETCAVALDQRMDGAEIALLRSALAPLPEPARSPCATDDLAALAARLAIPLPTAWTEVAPAARSSDAAPITIVRRPFAPVEVTARERSVLEQLALAQSNKSIARALDLSHETVKWHIANLLHKLGASDRKGLVQRSVDLGLAEWPQPPR